MSGYTWKLSRRKNISTLDNFSWILQTCFALCLCESYWSLWEVYEKVQIREDEKVREGREREAEEELEEGKEAMLRGGGSCRRAGGRKYEENGEKEGTGKHVKHYERIMRRSCEHYENISGSRSRKRGGIGGGRSWRRAKGIGVKFWVEEEAKVEEIMRESWEDYERIMRILVGRRARKKWQRTCFRLIYTNPSTTCLVNINSAPHS